MGVSGSFTLLRFYDVCYSECPHPCSSDGRCSVTVVFGGLGLHIFCRGLGLHNEDNENMAQLSSNFLKITPVSDAPLSFYSDF